MRMITIGGQTIGVQGGAWAPFLYDQEFSTETTCFFTDLSRSPDPVFLLKVAWAMAKTYDETFPPFEQWAKTLNISMQAGAPWTQEVVAALNAEVFRSTDDSDGEPRQED